MIAVLVHEYQKKRVETFSTLFVKSFLLNHKSANSFLAASNFKKIYALT